MDPAAWIKHVRRWATPRVLAPFLVVVAVIAVAAVILTPDPDPDAPATAAPGGPRPTDAGPTTPGAPEPEPAPLPKEDEMTQGEQDRYCAAWAGVGLNIPASGEEEEGVDLVELTRTFETLEQSYVEASGAAPADLVADYQTVIGYLRTSRDAARSGDVEQVKVMVTNLGTLNEYMSDIETASRRMCR